MVGFKFDPATLLLAAIKDDAGRGAGATGVTGAAGLAAGAGAAGLAAGAVAGAGLCIFG